MASVYGMSTYKTDILDENEAATNDYKISLLELPDEILENILKYLNYNDSAEARNVCQTFNKICEQRLNLGFAKVDRLHSQIQKRVKSQLPRRESERRNHPLARHVDILSAIETRLSLLGMTYMRYIDMGLCCFIPGKVLDELFRILLTLQKSEQPPRAHEFLQELRDISSMAMEHFEEKIAPGLKAKMPAITLPFPFGDCSSPESTIGPSTQVALASPTIVRGPSIKQEVIRLQNQLRSQGSAVTQFRKEMNEWKRRDSDHRKKSIEQDRKIQAQNKLITEISQTLTDQERQLSDMSKKILEYDQKFSDVYSELLRLKGDSDSLQSSQSSSGSEPCSSQSDGTPTAVMDIGDKKTRDSLKRKSLKDISRQNKKLKI